MKSFRRIVLMLLFSAGMSFALSAQQEVTKGLVRQYSIDLTKVSALSGVKMIHWQVTRKDGTALEASIISTFPDAATTNHSIDVLWDGVAGDTYVLTASLEDNNSCFSEAISQELIILPSDANFTFADGSLVTACSFNGVAESKSFDVTYEGVKPWKLHYRLTADDGTTKDLIALNAGGDEIEFATTDVNFDVDIDAFFINSTLIDKDWTIELIKAVSLADGHETLPNGTATSVTVKVYSLPVINGGISLN